LRASKAIVRERHGIYDARRRNTINAILLTFSILAFTV